MQILDYIIYMYYIVGLGNPGEEYKISRHNTGRIVLGELIKPEDMEFEKKLKALVKEGKKAIFIFPETFMNKSGDSLKLLVNKIIKKKKAENLIVVHDDIDIPLGKFKISFGKNSGGHKGVESMIRVVKTKDFIRIRVGVSPATPKGKIKKPDSKKMIDYIIGNFTPKELQVIKKISKKIALSIETIIKDGLQKAMNISN